MSNDAKRVAVWPLGLFAIALLDSLFNQWTLYFHAPAGATAAANKIGAAMMASYLLQGAAHPVVAVASDRLRHRWGRRRPLILLGCPLLALNFVAMWLVSADYAMLLIPIHGLLFTTVAQPYLALLPGLSSSSRTRIRLMSAGSVLALVAGGSVMIVGPAVAEASSFALFGIVGAVAAILLLFVPALLLREPAPSTLAPQQAGFFLQSREVLTRPLATFLLGNGCFMTATTAFLIVIPYIPATLLGREMGYLRVLNSILFAGLLFSIPIVLVLSRRIAMRRLYQWSGFLSSGVIFSIVVVHLFGASAMATVLWCAAFFLFAPGVYLMMAAPPLILSQLADADGKSREALFFGLNGMIAMGAIRAIAGPSTSSLLGFGTGPGAPHGVLAVLGFVSLALFCSGLFLHAHKPIGFARLPVAG